MSNKNFKKSFINTILNSDTKNKESDDFVRMFLKDIQKKLKRIKNVIQKK
jgi:hypothetical protein|tara:strand:- start:574 stop:723 length:150 start_codon:yes stop_codon:yes gene_type:complete